MDRRSFIKGLIRVGACVAFDPNRVIFDVGRGLFLPKFPPSEYFAAAITRQHLRNVRDMSRIDGLDTKQWGGVTVHPTQAEVYLRLAIPYYTLAPIDEQEKWRQIAERDLGIPVRIDPDLKHDSPIFCLPNRSESAP